MFWCSKKFGPGHKCNRQQLYMMTIESMEDDEEEIFVECKQVIRWMERIGRCVC